MVITYRQWIWLGFIYEENRLSSCYEKLGPYMIGPSNSFWLVPGTENKD